MAPRTEPQGTMGTTVSCLMTNCLDPLLLLLHHAVEGYVTL